MWLVAFAIGIAYFVAAKLAIATALPPEGIVVLWPPNAILLAALLSARVGNWWIYFLVTLAAEVAADVPAYPLAAALGYGFVNFFEAALAASLIRRFAGPMRSLSSVRDLVIFVISGPLVASASAALLGAAIYKLGSPDIDYLHYWRVFWFGDATGLLIVGATILIWRQAAWRAAFANPFVIFEAVALIAGLSAVAILVFETLRPAGVFSPRSYLLFPFLLWSAFRFGRHGASATIAITAAIAIVAAVQGDGPFAGFVSVDSVLALQGLLAIVSLSILTIAFAIEELQKQTLSLAAEAESHNRTEAKLHQSYRALEQANVDLDRQVAVRTRELRESLARNEMLLQEVHHRVKNDLQLVASVLQLYARSVVDPLTRQKFLDVQAQIGGIAEVHELIYQTGSFEAVDFRDLVRGLCAKIAKSAGPHVDISVETRNEGVISPDTAVVLSLVMNELITNAIKYGTVGGGVEIVVKARVEDERLVVTVADSGPGFPDDLDIDRQAGFGMRMTREIIQQAGGVLRTMPSARGARLEIVVPLAAARMRQRSLSPA